MSVRAVNGALALALLIFFLGHATLATFDDGTVPDFAMVALWAAVAVTACHIALSIVTSRAMLTDTVRPPSDKKKTHLALKWASGIALLSAAIIHCQVFNGDVAFCAALLLICLGVHGWMGARSLLKDVRAPLRWKIPYRVMLCSIVAVIGIAAIV